MPLTNNKQKKFRNSVGAARETIKRRFRKKQKIINKNKQIKS